MHTSPSLPSTRSGSRIQPSQAGSEFFNAAIMYYSTIVKVPILVLVRTGRLGGKSVDDDMELEENEMQSECRVWQMGLGCVQHKGHQENEQNV